MDATGNGFFEQQSLIGRTTIEAYFRSSEAHSSLFLNGFRCACSAAAFRAGCASNPARFRLAMYGQIFALRCNIGSRRQASGWSLPLGFAGGRATHDGLQLQSHNLGQD